MSVPNLLAQAAELNEDGVYELADGSFGEAVQSFENAVKTMMQVCQITTTQAEGAAGPANEPASAGSSMSSSTSSASLNKQLEMADATAALPPPCRSSVEVPFENDERFYIYSCTVTFSPPSSSTNSNATPSELAFYCATILFNLALAHHQQGQKQRQRTATPHLAAASLRQALVLYQEAVRTLQCIATPALSCRDDILLMTLAILNNQAQILEALQDQHRTFYFQQLLTQSMAALHSSNNFSIFEQSQINEFIRNAMVASASSCGSVGGEVAAACA